MALKKTITTPVGFTQENAYCRVEEPTIQDKIFVRFKVRCYHRADDGLFFYEAHLTGPYDIEGDNPIAQAYAHAKTVEPFIGAEDC